MAAAQAMITLPRNRNRPRECVMAIALNVIQPTSTSSDGRVAGSGVSARVAWQMSLPLARRIAVSFPALRHRDFTLLWIGQLLSFAGSRMQTAAILWHVSLLAAPART